MRFSFLKRHVNELVALLLFFIGGTLSMLGLIQRVPLILGILGVVTLSTAMFFFCLRYSSEKVYKDYYKDSYNIEHETIEDEIKKSMTYHRYQESVLNRYESLCRDLGISDEQRDYLLMLLMEEKNRVDDELKNTGGGYI